MTVAGRVVKATFRTQYVVNVAFTRRPAAYVGATSYRARRRVNDAVPDVIARRSTA